MALKCPKCGSEQIHSEKKGFSPIKGVIGTIAGGLLVGAVTGSHGRNKIDITCLKCGHRFKPGEGVDNFSSNPMIEEEYKPSIKRELYKCHNCGKETRETIKCNYCGCILFPTDKIK